MGDPIDVCAVKLPGRESRVLDRLVDDALLKRQKVFLTQIIDLADGKLPNHMFISLDMLIADAGSWTLILQDIMDYYHEPGLIKDLPQMEFRDYIADAVGQTK